MEALEDRTVPTITLTNGTLAVTGTPGPDQLRVELNPSDNTMIQVSDGSSTQSFALTSVTQVNVNGAGGNDNITLNLGNGLINANGTSTLPINIVGGIGQNTITIQGNPSGVSLNETYTFGADGTSGTLTFSGGASATPPALTVTFSQVKALEDTATAANLTVNGTDGRDLIQITNGMPAPARRPA